ncbi:MAG: ribbon-helix-helix protein, CopG family [Candidatus Nanohaloarchaea archaeon]
MSERIAFVASDKLAERIDAEADELALTKSEVIRRALAEHLNGGGT